jgi:choice-of-anchor B domain-containing protein
MKRAIAWVAGCTLSGVVAASHDDTLGARFVDPQGVNGSDCLEHHEPCRSIQYALAQAEPGNTVKVAAGIYDMSGVEPGSFLFGVIKAQGGYREDEHFARQEPEANPTILVGVDPRYRQAMMRLGFQWAADRASAEQGIVDDSPAAALQATAIAAMSCSQGFAGQFPCRNVDFQAQISLNQFTSQPGSAANVWGLVDLNDNREYAVVGLRNGTAVVDVTDPVNPRQVTTVPGNSSTWREVKIYQHFDAADNRFRAYAYVTTEAANSGLQVLDLSGLPDSVTLATTLVDTGSQHTNYVSNIDYATNMALPGATAFLYLAGSNIEGGAWRAYSLANPAEPQFLRQAPAGQYMHDSTSLLITDQRTTQCAQAHNPCEILVDFNENTVDLWDVTDKAQPVMLSSTTYSDVSFTHSGWPTADQRHIIVHDELDEIQRGLFTQIYTMNVDDLQNPFIQASYQGPNTTTDHNGYMKGSLYYVSHYRRGLVVFDASNPAELREIGNFDTFLEPSADSAGTDGAWGVYPFYPSGTVVISDISNGLFILRDRTATLAQSAGQIGFAGTTTSVSENAGSAVVTVRRSNGFAGAVSIQFDTSDLTASAGSDYTTTSGTLNWAAGDLADRTITVSLLNDSQSEDVESLRITLSDVRGGATLDGAATFDVQITNDDLATPRPVGGGGGGALGASLLWLLGLLLLAARGQPQARRRAYERTDQMRLWHHGRA